MEYAVRKFPVSFRRRLRPNTPRDDFMSTSNDLESSEFPSPSEFVDLIQRVRTGDSEAATEVVRRFEPQIRLKIRAWMRLRGPEYRRVFDSMDVCQPVLANFFARASAGQFDLDKPDQLLGLLLTMARNELNQQARWHRAQRRDIRRDREFSVQTEGLGPLINQTPSRHAAGAELLREFQGRLSEEERRIAELRAHGSDWAAVAAEVGGTPEGRRKQLARALDRVAQELGFASSDDHTP